ncbi:MAG: hypothetical protein DRO00_01990, partial [Thermoproteota archaeon]
YLAFVMQAADDFAHSAATAVVEVSSNPNRGFLARFHKRFGDLVTFKLRYFHPMNCYFLE